MSSRPLTCGRLRFLRGAEAEESRIEGRSPLASDISTSEESGRGRMARRGWREEGQLCSGGRWADSAFHRGGRSLSSRPLPRGCSTCPLLFSFTSVDASVEEGPGGGWPLSGVWLPINPRTEAFLLLCCPPSSPALFFSLLPSAYSEALPRPRVGVCSSRNHADLRGAGLALSPGNR